MDSISEELLNLKKQSKNGRVYGTIAGPGHQFAVFGYFDGKFGDSGEPWFFDFAGAGYSILDYSFQVMNRKEFDKRYK